MAAPGVDILTTASFDPATAQPGDEVVSISGTSAAAASVAGAAALLAANEPELSNGVVVSRLARTADAAGDPADTGNGRLNLLRAMSDASTDAVQPAGAAPVGDGGPLVGPYVAAARNWVLTFVGSGSVTITPSIGTISAPASCGGTGGTAASQTVTSTCAPNITTSENDAVITFSAGAGFAGWSAAASASANSCTNTVPDTTNPCSLVFGSNGALTVTFNAVAVNQAPVNSVPGAQTTNEDTAKVFSTANGNLISISDADAGTNPVQVTLTATSGTISLSGTTGLVFATGDGTTDVTMTFTGTISAINTALAGLSYNPTLNFNGSAGLTITTNDQGFSGSGGAKSDTDSVAITVTPVNDAPTIDAIGNETVNEDAAAQTVNLSGITSGPSNESAQTLSVTATSSNTALIPNPTVTYTSPNATGSLSYQPVANQFGSATITVTVTDNGGIANGGDNTTTTTFTITVNSVNDAPSFTKGANQTVLEDSGAASVSGWATAISAGPANESSQTVDFVVTNDNNGLFSSQPAVSPGGTLTYTPAANANGSAIVTVNIHDDGGTANGGVDSSATQTFTITVTAVNDAPTADAQSVSVLEDSVDNLVTLTGSTGPANESGQTLAFVLETLPTNGTLSETPAGTAIEADDLPLELSNATLYFTPTSQYCTTANAFDFHVTDDGGIANGGVDTSAAATVSVAVYCINDAPTADAQSVSVVEDSVDQLVFLTGSTGPANESGQTLAFVLETLPTNGTLSETPAGTAIEADDLPLELSNATLYFTPTSQYCTTANAFDFHVTDDGGIANGGVDTSAAATVSVAVTCVNDAPSFTKGANQTVLEDSGAASVSGWATAISAGPANESSQTVDFVVTNDNNGLFSSQPAVSPGGTLTYTPAANANGSAIVTVNIHDDGGTANGGVDSSATQTFTITVTAVNDAPSFTKGGDQTVLEDAGAQTVNPWATAISAGPADESSQTVSFVITNNTQCRPLLRWSGGQPQRSADLHPGRQRQRQRHDHAQDHRQRRHR